MVMIASCVQCNPYLNKPAVIDKFELENSNTTQGKSANIEYNVQNANSIRIEADYNKDGTISDSEKDEILDYESGDAVFTTRALENIGDLEFKIIANGKDGTDVTETTNAHVIAHDLPDLSSSNFSGIEGRTITFELPTVEGVQYTTINISNDSSKIISSSLDKTANKFTIQATDAITEQCNYDVEFGYKIPETGITGIVCKVGNIINNLFEFSGKLEGSDNKGVGESGLVSLYDAGTKEVIGSGSADSNGNFRVQANKVDPTGVMVEAKLDRDSFYHKKIILPGEKGIKDVTGSTYRCISAPNFGLDGNYYYTENDSRRMSKADFREMLEAGNFSRSIRSDGKEAGLIRVDLDNLKIFELLKENYANSTIFYDASVLITFEKYLNDPQGIRACIGGKDLSDLIQKDGIGNVPLNGGTNHFDMWGYPNTENYVIISPSNINSTIVTYHNSSYLTGLIVGARILHGLNAGSIGEANFNHELEHVFLFPKGEIPVKFQYVSRGFDGGTMKKPGVADIKAGNEVMYEPTFSLREASRYVLGLVPGVDTE